MKNNNLNIFEFFILIYKNKLIFITYFLFFLLLGITFSLIYKPTYKIKLTIVPLSITEFRNFYINENQIFDKDEIISDDILINEISPLTLFYSFLNEIKNEKVKLNLKSLKITFNPFAKIYEIYLEDFSKDLQYLSKNINNLLENTNLNIIQNLIRNLNLQIETIDEIEKLSDNNSLKSASKKLIINKNLMILEGYENLKVVNFNIENMIIKSNIYNRTNTTLFFIIFSILISITHILFVSYFNRQKR